MSEATNGEEEWALIQEQWPTVLITDIMMPQMDGLVARSNPKYLMAQDIWDIW